MSIPAWFLDIFAAVMLLVAAVRAGQLTVACAWTRAGMRDADIAGSHLLMGIAMAGTLGASLSTLAAAAWEVIFAVMTAWFGWGRGQGSPRSAAHPRRRGRRPPGAVPGTQRGDALHVRRAVGPGTGRRLRDGRDGGFGRRHAEP